MILFLVAGSCKVCATLLDMRVTEEPESSSALATKVLPPGPRRRTWLVIISMFGRSLELEEESVLVEAFGGLDGVWCTKVWWRPEQVLQVAGFLQSGSMARN